MNYVQRTVCKTKIVNCPLETVAGAGDKQCNEENDVDENEPATYFTIREESMTAMSKLVNAVAPWYSIYVLNFRYLEEKPNLPLERI